MLKLDNLESILLENSAELHERYLKVKLGLKPIHENVTRGAHVSDGNLYTDHDTKHIAEVIATASTINSQLNEKLSAYEVFLLLISAQIHDIGNIIGRKNHERKISEVWNRVFTPLGFDQLDRSLAERIAACHGGSINGDLDTIQSIDEKITWNGHDVRPQYIAAILRMADELAECSDRASRTLMAFDRVPEKNLLYHVYALGLHSRTVKLRENQVNLMFAFSEKYFHRMYKRGSDDQYLIDEIYARTLKTWNECIYCTSFIPQHHVGRVSVEIEIFDEDYSQSLVRIKYLLKSRVMPIVNGSLIFDYCPELNNYSGSGPLTASNLSSILRKKCEQYESQNE